MTTSAWIDMGMHDVIWARTNHEAQVCFRRSSRDWGGFLGLSTAINAARVERNLPDAVDDLDQDRRQFDLSANKLNRIKTAVGRQMFPFFQTRDWLGVS